MGENDLMSQLPDELQKSIKDSLLQAFLTEAVPLIRNQVGDTMCEVAQVTLCRDAWPELVPFLLQICAQRLPQQVGVSAVADDTQSKAVIAIKLSAWTVVSKLLENCPDSLTEYLGPVLQCLTGAFQTEPDVLVRCKAAICVLR